jgi:hypothetical protein
MTLREIFHSATILANRRIPSPACFQIIIIVLRSCCAILRMRLSIQQRRYRQRRSTGLPTANRQSQPYIEHAVTIDIMATGQKRAGTAAKSTHSPRFR